MNKIIKNCAAGAAAIACLMGLGATAMTASAKPVDPLFEPNEDFIMDDLESALVERTIGDATWSADTFDYQIREQSARPGHYYAVITKFKDKYHSLLRKDKRAHTLEVPAYVPCVRDDQSKEDPDYTIVKQEQCPVGRIGDGMPLPVGGAMGSRIERVVVHPIRTDVFTIGDQAFRGMQYLKSVDMSEVAMGKVSAFAFAETPRLASFAFPEDYYESDTDRALHDHTRSFSIFEGAFYKAGYATNNTTIYLDCWTKYESLSDVEGSWDFLSLASEYGAFKITGTTVFAGSNVTLNYYHPEGDNVEGMPLGRRYPGTTINVVKTIVNDMAIKEGVDKEN